MEHKLLDVENLSTTFHVRDENVQAVRGVSLHVDEGEVLGIVGESGSGKSVTMKTVMGLLPENATVKGEKIQFEGRDLTALTQSEYCKIRGKEMTMIFQDPMTALDPLKKIGGHLTEVILRHGNCSKAEARARALEVLGMVGIPNPAERMNQYPHEFSGGMRQRVLIAMALSCRPKLLIADEPTTALDVTIQAQILDLLRELKQNSRTAIVLISHDMGVVASICSRIVIMYGGLVMEEGLSEEIFYQPRHPYTKALLKAIPTAHRKEGERLVSIPGLPPSLSNPPAGCPFAERCGEARPECRGALPPMRQITPTHKAMCHFVSEG